MKGIKNKIAVVTGGARGLGKEMARRLAQEGALVIIADILKDAAESTAKEIEESGGKADFYEIDLVEMSEIDRMIDWVIEKYKSLDILINNAGINIREYATEISEENFDKVMDLNLKSYYFCSRAAARYMKKQDNGGCIVCTSSGNSKKFTTKRTPYCISKAAVNGLVAALANEWGRDNIRVNGVAPGYIMTDMVKEGIAEGIIEVDKIMTVLPNKRFLEPEEIASAVVFLASDEASGITGQTLFVDGGWSVNGLPED
ncbi:MAG TPA: SDR family oxidoreductase [Clostridiaceae bacterium]|nr:SDR family oxidoreductase [Clostridiaceae bacterium]